MTFAEPLAVDIAGDPTLDESWGSIVDAFLEMSLDDQQFAAAFMAFLWPRSAGGRRDIAYALN